MNSPHDVALDPECSSLLSFQDSLHGLFNSRLGSQAKQIAAKLPMAANHFNSLSRAGKITLTCGCGLFLWWLYARYNRKTKIVAPQAPQRKRRVRTISNSTWLASETSSSISRPSYNWAELQKQSVSDQDSVISAATLVDGTQLAPQQLGLMGMEALETVIGYWEDALAAYNPTATNKVLTTSEETMFIKSIEDILEAAYELQENSEMLFIHQNSILNKRELALQHKASFMGDNQDVSGADISKRTSVLSISTLEEVSFVSAQDTVADLRDFDDLTECDTEKLAFYQTALDLYETNGIPYRVMRTEFLGCNSDTEYLGKLHCLREAFVEVMKDSSNKQWWVDNGRLILGQLLVKSEKDPKEFLLAFDDMLDFLSEEGTDKQMLEELSSRNVQSINFYDVCLDYILIDSFEDLESPPSSVMAVMKNRWLSNSFKESALQTAIWSVFQAKRRLLQFPNGFKAKFYNVSEILTPTLAWAFFGPDEDLCKLMNEFKEQVLGFLRDMFSFHSADYTTLDSLAQSVMSLAKARLDTVKRKLDCADLNSS